MQFSNVLLVLASLSAGSQFVLAAPEPTAKVEIPAEVKGAGEMKYIGPITPGGEDHTLWGTAQEVYAQLVKLNPKFNPKDFKFDEPAPVVTRDLEERNKQGAGNCGRFGFVNSPAIQSGINYLAGLPGRCFVAGGPRVCARIACQSNSGISLCNDNTYSIDPSCRYLSGYAADIVNVCGPGNSGQEFDTDHYNVIVGSSSC